MNNEAQVPQRPIFVAKTSETLWFSCNTKDCGRPCGKGRSSTDGGDRVDQSQSTAESEGTPAGSAATRPSSPDVREVPGFLALAAISKLGRGLAGLALVDRRVPAVAAFFWRVIADGNFCAPDRAFFFRVYSRSFECLPLAVTASDEMVSASICRSISICRALSSSSSSSSRMKCFPPVKHGNPQQPTTSVSTSTIPGAACCKEFDMYLALFFFRFRLPQQ